MQLFVCTTASWAHGPTTDSARPLERGAAGRESIDIIIRPSHRLIRARFRDVREDKILGG